MLQVFPACVQCIKDRVGIVFIRQFDEDDFETQESVPNHTHPFEKLGSTFVGLDHGIILNTEDHPDIWFSELQTYAAQIGLRVAHVHFEAHSLLSGWLSDSSSMRIEHGSLNTRRRRSP